MTRWLYAHETVVGRPERLEQELRGRIRDLLRAATGTEDDTVDVDGSFLLRFDREETGVGVTKTVRVSTGIATRIDRVERRMHIPLRWHADPARHAFPTFDGAVELAPLSATTADLILIGTYTPPLGPVGAVADSLGLHGIAERTARHLLAALADHLERAAHEGRAEEPEPAATPASPLRVRELMTPDPLTFDDDLPLRTAALLLRHHAVHGAPVIDEHADLVGVISEADLLEKEAVPSYGLGREADEAYRRREARTVGEACSRPARTTHPDATVHEAARAMLDAHVARLVVVDDCRVAGIITRSDVLGALLRTDFLLETAIREVLEDASEPDVAARVEWGNVALTGEVSLRSRVGGIIERITEIDGIIAVDADLTWRTDDVVLPVTPML